jgi:hypothetical protein
MTAGRATVQTEDLLKALFVLLVVLFVIGVDPALGTAAVSESLSSALG